MSRADGRTFGDGGVTIGGDVFRARYVGTAASRSGRPGYAGRLVTFTACAFAGCLAAGVAMSLVPEAAYEAWLSEGGPVETASGVLYLVLAAGLAATALRRLRDDGADGRLEALHPALAAGCAAVLAAREHDWHNAWTTMGVLKTKFYVSPEVGAGEKAVVVAVLSMIAVLVAQTALRCGPPLAARLRSGDRAAWLTAVGIWLLPLSKTLDSTPRLMRAVVEPPAALGVILKATEEIAELVAPSLLVVALAVSVAAAGDASARVAPQPATAASPVPRRRAA